MEKITTKSLTMLRRLPEDAVIDQMPSPLGVLTIVASNKHLLAVLWDRDWDLPDSAQILKALPRDSKNSVIVETRRQLKEYFAGCRKKFQIPMKLDGTDFQKSAWQRLKKIPYGQTISYKEQAISLGDKNKVRAVGGANSRNPISIIVPCHRVVAHSGALTGFGGGLDKKDFLIQHEQSFV